MKIDWNKVEEGYSLMQVLEKENKQLKGKLQQKENIIKGLDNTIENLEEVVKHKNNIIKEVREYIEKSKAKLPLGRNDFTCEMVYSDEVVLANELLEILDKENI